MAFKPMRAVLAALLLTACSGSLVDHFSQLATQPDGGGGGVCPQTPQACEASCLACVHLNGKVAACTENQCTYTDAPAPCTPPLLTCDTGIGCCAPTQIAAGGDTTCAIFDANTVRCWGEQLGSGVSSAFPVKVEGLSAVSSIAVGPSHACAIVSNEVRCWGANESGQLGQAVPASSATPLAAVPGIPSPLAVVVGARHSCARTQNNGVLCWGANDAGQLGDPTGATPSGPTPVAVAGTTSASSITAGLLDTCVTIGDTISCWGGDVHGQLGNGRTGAAFSISPVTFKGGNTANPILASGESHNCAIVNSAIQCWGAGTLGQLGLGTAADQSVAGKVGFFAPGILAAGGSHTCATTAGGGGATGDDDPNLAIGLYCWGANDSGQLATPTSQTPVRAPAGSPIVFTPNNAPGQLAAGTSHTCALLSGGFLSCWGKNDKGQVGNGSTAGAVTSPTQVTAAAQ